MADEKQAPLRKLFTEPERLENVESHGGGATGRVPPLKILKEAESLDPPLDRIVGEILKIGDASLSELAAVIDMEPDSLETRLEELELQGYVTHHTDGGERYYELDGIWESEEFPAGPIIPLVYQYNLLSDESRLSDLHAAIDTVVDEGDVVADLGAGAGILSFLASQNAEQVYAVEVDPTVYRKGRSLMREQGVDNVDYLKGDARTVSLPEEVDVVICEMLDTALAAELQVPVMNHAVEELLAADGRTIPYRTKTTARLVESDYHFHGGEFRLPHFEAYGSRESLVRSEEVTYHEISFDTENGLFVDETLAIPASSAGVVNGVQLNTYTQFARGQRYTGPSEWLNPPLTIPTEEDYYLEAGEELKVSLSYTLAGGLNDIEQQVSRADEP